jgi:hypothetical protein
MADGSVLVIVDPLSHDVRVNASRPGPDADGRFGGPAGQVEDRGSFSHGVCRVCGWTGPGRRSRVRARTDLEEHAARSCAGSEDLDALPS